MINALIGYERTLCHVAKGVRNQHPAVISNHQSNTNTVRHD